MKTSLSHFEPTLQIDSVDTGFLVLAARVIMQAVEDVRLYLVNPVIKKGHGRQAKWNVDCWARKRKANAQAAAEYLQGPECRELCKLLESSGYRVPLKKLWHQLSQIKKPTNPQEVPAHG